MNVKLKNGYVFPYDFNKRFVCYYGCNSVGKTVISNELDNLFSSQGREVLHFSNDIMDEMIDFDEKTKSIQIFPKITEIAKLNEIKNSYVNDYSFTKAMKEVGLTKANDRNLFPNVQKCSNEDGLLVDEPDAKYNKDELTDIFGVSKGETTKNYYQLITNNEVISQISNMIGTSSLFNAENASVINLRKTILDKKLDTCPVCFSNIDEERTKIIGDTIKNISLSDDIKNDLIAHLRKKTNMNIFSDLISQKNNYEKWLQDFKRDLDDSLIAYAYSKIDDKKRVVSFRKTINDLNTLKTELSKYEIPKEESNQSEYDKRINSLLNEHKVFNRSGISISIKKGRLEMKGITYEDLSQSEKNFLKFLYFDILLLSKSEDSKIVDLIIDDPFDSYDEATISNLLYIITNSLRNHSSSINAAYVFSHSIRLIYFYQEVKRINKSFELKWIDRMPNDNTLHIFDDIKGFLEGVDYSPSDYWIANRIITCATDEYSVLCSSIILREFVLESTTLMPSSPMDSDFKKYYDVISNNVVHLRDDNYTIDNVYDDMKKLFGFAHDANHKEKKIVDIMKDIDDNVINKIVVTYASGVSLDNSIYKLMISKHLLSLKIRQILQDFLLSKHPDLNKDTVGANIEIAVKNNYSDLDNIVNFYNRNKIVLNEFAHSFTKSFSPFFTYCYEDLAHLYLSAKAIISN